MAPPLPDSWKKEIASLIQRHKKCRANITRSPNSESLRKEMTEIFKQACQRIRDLDCGASPLIWGYVDASLPILLEGAKLGIQEPCILDILEYRERHGAPVLVEDTSEVIPKRFRNEISEWSCITVGPTITCVGNKVVVESDKVGYGTEPWDEQMNHNPKSSPLARFRTNLPALTPLPTQTLSQAVYSALCEVSSLLKLSPPFGETIEPIKSRVSRGGTCLALLGTTGGKTRYPWVGYSLLDKDISQPFALPRDKCFQAGLSEVASHLTVDETRKLIFVADKTRVKSFAWGDSRRTFKQALPTHTLDSWRFEGPILSLPNGTVLRAGRAAAAVWVIDDLETHGPKGDAIIGRKLDFDEYDEELDECPDIEESSGTPRASHIFFHDEPTLEPDLWEHMPDSSTVICAEPRFNSGKSGVCLAIDFEHNGKTTIQFKGHPDSVTDFSTNTTDPHVFLTGCHDGRARLFDMRQSYHVMEFKAGFQYDCGAVALAYPDGVPTVFTGTYRHEQVKVWDVRARTCVYELATGNNRVKSLTWDGNHNNLFAVTSCGYRDESRSYAYRQANIPRRRVESHPNNKRESRKPRCWPRQAWHAEDYFEYAFDAGEDRVYRYAFKERPDRYILPEYGEAQEDSYDIDSNEEDSDMAYDRDSGDDDSDEDEMEEY